MAGARRAAIEAALASSPEPSVESPKIDPAPLNVVRMTPPVEATLRILLNSVPYLIGAAVVRQPAVGDAVEAEVGRMPWLHDRRLLTLQLPDDSLPANRAILLDWPVPYQAEWVGVPPRLLISRLVTQDRTVGVSAAIPSRPFRPRRRSTSRDAWSSSPTRRCPSRSRRL